MKIRTTIILFVLVVAAALFLAFHTGRQLSDEEYDIEQRRIFPAVDYQAPDDLMQRSLVSLAVEVSLHRGDERLVIQRDPSDLTAEWWVTEPVRTRAETGRVRGFLSDLELLVAERTVESDEPIKSGYGMSSPRLRIGIATFHRQLELVIGDPTLDGAGVYLMRKSEPRKVFVVSADAVARLNLSLSELREKSVLRFDPERVNRIRLIMGGQTQIAFERVESGWRVTAPFDDVADAGEVMGLLNTLGKVRVEPDDFVGDAPGELAQYGLDNPILAVALRFDKGTERRLLIGDKAPEESGMAYAKRDDEPSVFLVPEKLFGLVMRSPDDIRTHRALPFSPADVRGLKVSLPDESIRLTKTDDTWHFEEPEQRADLEAVRSFISDLHTMSVLEWFDDVTPQLLDRAGLNRPSATVAVEFETGEDAELRFGDVRDDGARFVRRGTRGPVMAVRPGFYDRLMLGREAFVSFVVMAFDPENAQRVEIDRPGEDAAIERDATGTWRLAEPVSMAANAGAVHDLLWKLCRVEARNKVGDPPPDGFGLGNARIRVRVVLGGAAPAETLNLLIGNEARGGSAYARVEGNDTVFLLPRDVVKCTQAEFASKVLCSFNPGHVEAIRFQLQDSDIERRIEPTENGWRMAGSGIHPRTAEAIVNELKDLRADSVWRYRKSDVRLEETMLDPAYLTIRITLAGGEERVLRMAPHEGEQWLAVTSDAPCVYEVRANQFIVLSAALKRGL